MKFVFKNHYRYHLKIKTLFIKFKNGGDHPKGVFLISQPLTGLVVETLRDIITSSKFQFIIIITNVSPLAYGETADFFDSIKDNCLIWMNDAVNKLT